MLCQMGPQPRAALALTAPSFSPHASSLPSRQSQPPSRPCPPPTRPPPPPPPTRPTPSPPSPLSVGSSLPFSSSRLFSSPSPRSSLLFSSPRLSCSLPPGAGATESGLGAVPKGPKPHAQNYTDPACLPFLLPFPQDPSVRVLSAPPLGDDRASVAAALRRCPGLLRALRRRQAPPGSVMSGLLMSFPK